MHPVEVLSVILVFARVRSQGCSEFQQFAKPGWEGFPGRVSRLGGISFHLHFSKLTCNLPSR